MNTDLIYIMITAGIILTVFIIWIILELSYLKAMERINKYDKELDKK